MDQQLRRPHHIICLLFPHLHRRSEILLFCTFAAGANGLSSYSITDAVSGPVTTLVPQQGTLRPLRSQFSWPN
ncbi:hypothetical protein OF83DRAFT_1142666, partial [Amylostereum chailletii]